MMTSLVVTVPMMVFLPPVNLTMMMTGMMNPVTSMMIAVLTPTKAVTPMTAEKSPSGDFF